MCRRSAKVAGEVLPAEGLLDLFCSMQDAHTCGLEPSLLSGAPPTRSGGQGANGVEC